MRLPGDPSVLRDGQRSEDRDQRQRPGDGASALRAARALHPDAVLLDVHLPDMDGFAVAAALAREEPAPRVVLTSTDAEEEVASLLRRSGAIRFVPKETLAAASMHALWEAAT